MYRHITVLFAFFVLFSLVSCKSTPKEILIADMDPLEAGIVDGGVMAYFPTRIKQIPLTLSFDPRSNTVYMQFSYQTVTYRQYWDPPSRVRFISAVERYHADYEARNLPERKHRRSRRAYDVLDGLTEWGAFRFMINARSHPKVYLGYTFRENSPYCLITQTSAKNELSTTDIEQNSLQIELYFTRAMAADLARLLDQDHLTSLVPDRVKNRAPDAFIPSDDYSAAPQPDAAPDASQSDAPVPGTSQPDAASPADSPGSTATIPEETPLPAR
jgi:hypothetical protein